MEVRHNCAVVIAHTLNNAYSFLEALQHRGREVASITAIGETIDAVIWEGQVATFDLHDLFGIFPHSDYHTFMGHIRYATRGKKEYVLQEGHPHVIGGTRIDYGSHILIYDCEAAIVHNGQVDVSLLEGIIDKTLLRTNCDTEALLHYYMKKGEEELVLNIPGAYTLAIADKRNKDVIVIRDMMGIRPGVLSWKDGKHNITSEDIAARKNDAKVIEHLEPGVIYYLSPDGGYKKKKVNIPRGVSYLKMCFFESNYIADRDSEIFQGIPVNTLRSYLGEELANEFVDIKADLITYAPRCPCTAAMSMHEKTGISFDGDVFYKMRGERSFLGSTKKDRAESIKSNLYLNSSKRNKLKEHVIVVDDSSIRGNVAERIIKLLEEAGVRKVDYLNYTPMIGIIKDNLQRGCFFGVDMPPDDDFIARNRTEKEISEYLCEKTKTKMEFNMHYLSIDGMFRAYERLGYTRDKFCYFCIGGEKPF